MGHLPEGKVLQAYDTTLFLDQRRQFLQDWEGCWSSQVFRSRRLAQTPKFLVQTQLLRHYEGGGQVGFSDPDPSVCGIGLPSR